MKSKLFFLMFFILLVGNIFAQPSNDLCSGAINLTVNGSCSTINVTGATQTMAGTTCTVAPSSNPTNDVWYTFTAGSSSQTITATPSNSNYDVVVDLMGGCSFGSQVACADAHNAGAAETINATGLSVGTTYYIRVYDFNGTAGGNITVCVTGSGGGCSLTGVTPTLASPGTTSSPGPTISNTTPTLSWNVVTGAGMYGVYVRDMTSNTLVVNNNCVTSGTSYTIPSGTLSSSGQYRWAVIAYDACNGTCQSNQATPFYFQTPGNPCALSGVTPTLVSPGTSSSPGTTISTTTPTLSWNALSGATNYDVYVSISPYGTSNIVYQQTCVSGTSITVPSGNLNSGSQYRWNIQANVSCGSCVSSYASPYYFNVSTCTPVTVSTQPQNQTVCLGNTATFSVSANGTPPFSYFWYTNGSFTTNTTNTSSTTDSYQTPPLTTADNGNTYYCKINNCNNMNQDISTTVNVIVTSPPVVSANSNSPVTAPGTLTLSATTISGATYSWTGPNGWTSTQPSPSISSTTTSMSGNYCVIATLNGCTSTQSCANVVITNCTSPSTPTVTQSGATTFCQGGSVTLTSSSCSGCTYSWSPNGQTTQAINASTAGNYSVTVNNGCSTATSSPAITVTVNSAITPSVSISSNPTGAICAGINVTFTANPVNGGTPSYQWKLNNNIVGGNTTYSNSSLVNGDQISCVITSTASCASPTTATSNSITMVVNSINVSTTTTTAACGQSNGSATATASGGSPPYTYHWSNGQNTQTATGLAANTYTVTATGSGCTATTTASVSNTGGPGVTTSSTLDNGTCNGTATVNANGGVPPYTYLWSSNANNQTTATATALCGNITYNITVKDANNCITTATVTVAKTVGITEQTESTIFVIYPNPTSGSFTLSYETTGTEDLQIRVLNIAGEVVYSKEYTKVNGKFLKEINLTNVATGIYSVEIKTGEKIYLRKLVKE